MQAPLLGSTASTHSPKNGFEKVHPALAPPLFQHALPAVAVVEWVPTQEIYGAYALNSKKSHALPPPTHKRSFSIVLDWAMVRPSKHTPRHAAASYDPAITKKAAFVAGTHQYHSKSVRSKNTRGPL